MTSPARKIEGEPRGRLLDKVKFDPNLDPQAMFHLAERKLAGSTFS